MGRDDNQKLQTLLRGSTRQQLVRALARMLMEQEKERRRQDAQRKLERGS